jgi:hypothetical protein
MAIAVRRPKPVSMPPLSRSNKAVRSEASRMDQDDQMSIKRFQKYLAYAPKIVLPVTLRKLRRPLTQLNLSKLEADTARMLEPSHPARCTSAQYVDRNGVPLLYYFGRRLVRSGDKKASFASARFGYLIIMRIRTPYSLQSVNTKISLLRKSNEWRLWTRQSR